MPSDAERFADVERARNAGRKLGELLVQLCEKHGSFVGVVEAGKAQHDVLGNYVRRRYREALQLHGLEPEDKL